MSSVNSVRAVVFKKIDTVRLQFHEEHRLQITDIKKIKDETRGKKN